MKPIPTSDNKFKWFGKADPDPLKFIEELGVHLKDKELEVELLKKKIKHLIKEKLGGTRVPIGKWIYCRISTMTGKEVLSITLYYIGDYISELMEHERFSWMYPYYSKIMLMSCRLDQNATVWKDRNMDSEKL